MDLDGGGTDMGPSHLLHTKPRQTALLSVEVRLDIQEHVDAMLMPVIPRDSLHTQRMLLATEFDTK